MSLQNPNSVSPNNPKRIALVISNPAISSTTGWPVGFWWSELTHPYFAFLEAGMQVDIFSPEGGSCTPDAMSDPRDPSGYSKTDLISLGFISSPDLLSLINTTKPIREMNAADYDALVVAGGQAPMFAFESQPDLIRAFVNFYESGKVTAALCHGTAILRYAMLSDGSPLVEGKTVTGFANVEEDYADNAVWQYGLLPKGNHIMPWRIEDELKKLGANFIQAGLWRSFAVRDGHLITGQQNFSGLETARLVIEAIGR